MLSNKEPMPGTTFLTIRNRLMVNVNEILTISIVKENDEEYFVQAYMKSSEIVKLHTAYKSLKEAESFYVEVKNALFDLDTVRMIGI